MKYITFVTVLATLLSLSPAALADSSDEPIHIARLSPPIKFENVVETVVIGNEHYQVPEPWAGNRLFPTGRNLNELKQIPPEHTYEGSEIYILAEALEPLLAMVKKAQEDGVELLAESGYRSANYQQRIFLRRMKQGHSFEKVCKSVAPPGYSRHMLGTAIDFSPSDWRFAETAQYQWLQENGAIFGFEETYSRNNRYNHTWESWEWSYTGKKDEQPVIERAQNSGDESDYGDESDHADEIAPGKESVAEADSGLSDAFAPGQQTAVGE